MCVFSQIYNVHATKTCYNKRYSLHPPIIIIRIIIKGSLIQMHVYIFIYLEIMYKHVFI